MTPGKNSSEFWLIIACGVMMIASGTEYVYIDTETLKWFIGLSATYGGGRALVKRQGVKTAVQNGEQGGQRAQSNAR